MDSFLLLLTDDFILLQFKTTLFLLTSKVFEFGFELPGHHDKQIAFGRHVVELSQLLLDHSELLKEADHLQFYFEEDFLMFYFEEMLESFHFAIRELPQRLHLL